MFLSLPLLLLRALCRPFCRVECHECGLDFLRLALAVEREKNEALESLGSSSLGTTARSLSASGAPSLPFPSRREKFRENMSMPVSLHAA